VNLSQKQNIIETQAILMKVSKGIKVFFNIELYENRMGVVRSEKKWGTDAVGNKVVVGTNWYLTTKGKMILNITV